MRRSTLLIVLSCLGMLFPSFATAQQFATCELRGHVADSTGGALPGVAVTANHVATNTDYRRTTNASGDYVVTGLRPGQYRVRFELSGFKPAERTGILLEVNQQGRVDAVLQLGEVAEVITIVGDASTVETSNATLKTVVDSRRMIDLPLNGRNALQLQALTPGAVRVLAGQAATTIALNTANSFSINGARPNGSAYYLDGGINMDMYNNVATSFPNPDALQEFSVLANSASAAYGRNAGGVVNMVTKSGTNDYRGSAYGFLRDDALNATNFFAKTKPKLQRYQYGATVGGPIIKDKTFFFVSYEGTREKNARTNSSTIVPTERERRGDFSQSPLTSPVRDPLTGLPFPGNLVPANRLNPVAVAFAQTFMPLPNSPGNIYAYNLLLPTDDDQVVARVDHQLTAKNRVSARFFYDNYANQANASLPAFNTEFRWRTKNMTLSDVHTFGTSIVNTATVTYANNPFIRSPVATNPHGWGDLGCISCVPLGGPDEPTDWFLSVNRGLTLQVNTAFKSYMTNWHVTDNVTWAVGRHLFRAGGEFGDFRRKGREFFQHTPQFSFNGTRSGSGWGYADYFLGLPSSVSQVTPLKAETSRVNVALNVEDEWKLSRRVTLNLGLRWEPFFPIHSVNDELEAFRPGQQSTIYPLAPTGLVFPGDSGVPRGIIDPQYDHFAPRIGLAFDPRGDGKTSIRAAWGLFYETIRLVALNTVSTKQPFAFFPNLSNPNSLTDPYGNNQDALKFLLNYSNPQPGQKATWAFFKPLGANSIDPAFTPPRYQQWNVSVQHELFRDFVLQAAYVGSKGENLLVGQEINPGVYIPGASTTGNLDARRIYPEFQSIQNTQTTGHSRYNALQVSLNKRFSRGFSLLASYVYSKSEDTASNDGNSGTANSSTDPRNPELDYGPSDFDVPHRFVLSFVWELPFFNQGDGWKPTVLGGWQLAGIVTLQSGTPFSVMSGAGNTRSLVGGAGDRADVIGSEKVIGDVAKYFDTSVYALPPLGTFGTAGRNSLRGPGYQNTDVTVQKLFRVGGTKALELRFEVFNLFNQPNFFNPNNQFGSSAFGLLTSARDPRIMQVGARFQF